MEPGKLEDLFNPEHLDVIQATLVELKAVEEEHLKECLEHDLLIRCLLSGDILGCR